MLQRIRRQLRAWRQREQLDDQLDTELQFHLDLEAKRLVEQGVTPDEARRHARTRFGGVDRVSEECRDQRGLLWLDRTARTVRYAARTLRRQPGFALVAILVLGLGIGANTAMFSVIYGVLLKPLPYVDGDRLVLLQESAPRAGSGLHRHLHRRALRLPSAAHGLQRTGGVPPDVVRPAEPRRARPRRHRRGLGQLLRRARACAPKLGRTFVDGDDDAGAPAVLVLSHEYWRTRFGGDPDIVGQTFQMNDRPHTVVGVLPPIPQYPADCDVYMPTSACPFRAAAERRIAEQRRVFAALQVFGRLKPGVPLEEAAAVGGHRRRPIHAAIIPMSTATARGFRPRPWTCWAS